MEIDHSVRASDVPLVGKVSHVEFRGVIGSFRDQSGLEKFLMWSLSGSDGS